MTEIKKRSRNKPHESKKYKSKDPKYDQRTHRKICPVCELKGTQRYMSKAAKQFRPESAPKTTKQVSVLYFCEVCRYIEWIEEGLEKIPK